MTSKDSSTEQLFHHDVSCPLLTDHQMNAHKLNIKQFHLFVVHKNTLWHSENCSHNIFGFAASQYQMQVTFKPWSANRPSQPFWSKLNLEFVCNIHEEMRFKEIANLGHLLFICGVELLEITPVLIKFIWLSLDIILFELIDHVRALTS